MLPFFGSCIIHILNTGVLKFKRKFRLQRVKTVEKKKLMNSQQETWWNDTGRGNSCLRSAFSTINPHGPHQALACVTHDSLLETEIQIMTYKKSGSFTTENEMSQEYNHCLFW